MTARDMTSMRAGALVACLAWLGACGGGGGGSNANPAVKVDPVINSPVEEKPWSAALSASQTHTIVGDVRVIDNFPMPQLGKTRRIWIYLPADYASTSKRYPVLYMQDGQNVFDTATSYAGEWGLDEAMLQMEKDDPALAAIVVAIDNGGAARTSEYMPSSRAGDYVAFIVQTLKPYVDSHYRSAPERAHTAIGGSSYGAYVSLYAGFTRQDVFGKIMSFSNVTVYQGDELRNIIAQAGRQQDLKVYMDIGALEESQFPGVVTADQNGYRQLQALGFSEQQVLFVQDPQGTHHETSWRRRFPAAWRWLQGN